MYAVLVALPERGPLPGSSWSVRLPGASFLNDREDVARRILEPGNQWAATPEDPELVVFVAVPLEADAALGELPSRRLDVADREVEHGVLRRHMVRLRIHQDRVAAGDVQSQHPVGLGHLDAERRPVELLGRRHITHREPTECLRVLEHLKPLPVLLCASLCTSDTSYVETESPISTQLMGGATVISCEGPAGEGTG